MEELNRTFAVAAVGRDRPGIVAELTGQLHELGCSLRDVATGVLSGHFALVMVVAAPGPTPLAAVRDRLRALEAHGLHVEVWEIDAIGPPPNPQHVLTVYGPDRPGIVHAVATELAGLGVSICDMTCRLQGGLYVLTMELEAPPAVGEERLEQAVAGIAGELGLTHSLRSLDKAEL